MTNDSLHLDLDGLDGIDTRNAAALTAERTAERTLEITSPAAVTLVPTPHVVRRAAPAPVAAAPSGVVEAPMAATISSPVEVPIEVPNTVVTRVAPTARRHARPRTRTRATRRSRWAAPLLMCAGVAGIALAYLSVREEAASTVAAGPPATSAPGMADVSAEAAGLERPDPRTLGDSSETRSDIPHASVSAEATPAPDVAAEAPPSPDVAAAPLDFPAKFPRGRAAPRAVDRAAIRALGETLRARCGDAPIVLTGHTCTLGAETKNVALGLERARRARRALAAEGVPRATMEIRSAGATQPVAGNDNENGRRRNRRVTASCAPDKEHER